MIESGVKLASEDDGSGWTKVMAPLRLLAVIWSGTDEVEARVDEVVDICFDGSPAPLGATMAEPTFEVVGLGNVSLRLMVDELSFLVDCPFVVCCRLCVADRFALSVTPRLVFGDVDIDGEGDTCGSVKPVVRVLSNCASIGGLDRGGGMIDSSVERVG